jgi:hypothetical protein
MTDTQFAEYQRLRAQELAGDIAEFFKLQGMRPSRCTKTWTDENGSSHVCNESICWVTHARTSTHTPYNMADLKNHLRTCIARPTAARDKFNSTETAEKRHKEAFAAG